ncbi:MAG: hypothetical protein WCO35_00840 [Candidatus Nomurabacteria bacterium]
MNLSWRQKRKNIFILLILVLVLSYSSFKIYPYFNVAPTCSDGKQNGDELGVDCGGSCQLVCPTQVVAFNVRSVLAVKSDKNLYDLVAMIENKNSDKDTIDGNIDYVFSVYDKAGSIIKTISGSTTIPIGQTFPLIVQNVSIDFGNSGNDLSYVSLKILDDKSWQKKDNYSVFANNFFKTVDTNFDQNKNNISQLTVTLQNLTTADFKYVPVRVVIYDQKNNLIGLNETIMNESKPKSSQNLIFTWRNPLPVSNPKINVYSIVTPHTLIK